MSKTAPPIVSGRRRARARPPAAESPFRIAARKDSVMIWNASLFGDPASDTGRLFLTRVFSLPEIKLVEIDRRKGSGLLRYEASAAPGEVLRKLKDALVPAVTKRGAKAAVNAAGYAAADALFLNPPSPFGIRICRIGEGLSTWEVHSQRADRVRLVHPLLRRRKDVAHRLDDELSTILGIRDFSINRLRASVTIRFDPRSQNVSRLLSHLEHAWPRLMSGADGLLPRTRLVASAGLLGLAFTAQFFVPPLTPFVLAGVVVYGFTNILSAAKLLLHGRIGLPVLYTGTLTFTIISGMPFSASLMAAFMQTWPRLAFRTFTRSKRRLFAAHLQQATWARLASEDGTEVEIEIDQLKSGDLIVIQKGETIPVDGVIESGLAAIEEEALSGKAGAVDKGAGDAVFAATIVAHGTITVRVTRMGTDTVAGFIGTHLPSGRIDHLPATAEAEHVATNMVLPALALSALNLAVTGNMVASRTIIRPDYATAPRFSAQLAALHEFADGLRRGILFRHHAALSRLPATDIYVFDDTPVLDRRRSQVGEIITTLGISSTDVLSYATSAFPSFQNERARALMEACIQERAPLIEICQRTRAAGVIRYRDEQGRLVEICTPGYVAERGLKTPRTLIEAVKASPDAWHWRRPARRGKAEAVPHEEPRLRPLWVIRDGLPLGVVTFHRKGDLEAVEVIATLKARNPNARFVHISSRPQAEASECARKLGIATAHGGLDAEQKAQILLSLGRRTMWIGDGTGHDAFLCVQASTVSISVAGAATLPEDLASVVFLQPSLRGLVPLRRIARRHRAQLRQAYRSVFAANLLCLAGAFVGGFTTLHAALLSNTATGYVYLNQRRWLHDLAHRMQLKRRNDIHDDTDDELQDDDASIAIEESEPREEFLDEDLDGPIADENPI